MMNNLYDFCEIERITKRQKRMIFGYILYALCFVCAMILAVILPESNILSCLFFGILLLFLILSSLVFWKIKYGILNEYKSFLDKMEMGKCEDFVGTYLEKVDTNDPDEPFCELVFEVGGEKSGFLVYSGTSLSLSKGEKYHIEHIGRYIYRWEKYENR